MVKSATHDPMFSVPVGRTKRPSTNGNDNAMCSQGGMKLVLCLYRVLCEVTRSSNLVDRPQAFLTSPTDDRKPEYGGAGA